MQPRFSLQAQVTSRVFRGKFFAGLYQLRRSPVSNSGRVALEAGLVTFCRRDVMHSKTRLPLNGSISPRWSLVGGHRRKPLDLHILRDVRNQARNALLRSLTHCRYHPRHIPFRDDTFR